MNLSEDSKRRHDDEFLPCLSDIIATGVELQASDVHILPNLPIQFRRHGAMVPHPTVTRELRQEDTFGYKEEVVDSRHTKRLEEEGSFDRSLMFEGGSARVRVNVASVDGGYSITCRIIPLQPKSLTELMAPAALSKWIRTDMARGGLVVISGLADMGKTTTLAGIVNHINETEAVKVCILEDPIEFHHAMKKAMIFCREVGEHTPTYHQGLRDMLRQNINVAIVGEVRDAVAMDAVFGLAESGLKVFTTVHASSAVETIERIVAMFPASDHERVFQRLRFTLRGVQNNWLLPRHDGNGRVLACDVLTVTEAVRACLKGDQAQKLAATARDHGEDIITLDTYKAKLAQKGLIR